MMVAATLGTPFFYQCAWYIKRDKKRVYLLAGTEAERALWRSGKRAKAFKPSALVMAELRKLIVVEVNGPSATTITNSGTTVGEAVPRYLADCKNRGVGSMLKAYTMFCNDFMAHQPKVNGQNAGPVIGKRPLASITPAVVRDWAASHSESWNSSSYVRGAIKALLQLFNWSVREQLIAYSPIKGMALPKETRREILIHEDEETEILNHCRLPEFKAFFSACMYSGRRPNEVAGLTDKNVTTQGDRMAWRIKGKNYSKTGRWEVVPLSPAVAELTRAALERAKPGEPLFPNSDGGTWNEQSWNDPLRRDNLDINPKITMYCCRHTYITRALVRGVPIAVVAHLVGNSVETLLKHYAHVEQSRADMLHEMAEKAVG